jgi:hypothetical protein
MPTISRSTAVMFSVEPSPACAAAALACSASRRAMTAAWPGGGQAGLELLDLRDGVGELGLHRLDAHVAGGHLLGGLGGGVAGGGRVRAHRLGLGLEGLELVAQRR